MPKGLARSEPIGIWRVGAPAVERVQAARRWAARLIQAATALPPFHRDDPAAAGRTS